MELDESVSVSRVAHGLGLRRERYVGPGIECLADQLGAALLAPRRRVLALVRRGPTLPELAASLEATESLAALRVGGVTGEPIVAGRIRIRGQEWVRPAEPELRRAVKDLPRRGWSK